MRYILLEISRRTIALYTNKGDGTRTFQPFGGGQTLPLALCYANGEYHTGFFAQHQKENGNREAFDDLFTEARGKGVCHEIKAIDFIPQVIRLTVAQICREYFLIDANRRASELTLILMYGIDVNKEERGMLTDALRADGYAKIIAADRAQRSTLATLSMNNAELGKNKAALIINSDNEDLSVSCISTSDGSTFVEKILSGRGKDPRFQYGIDQLWNGVESQTYSSKEKELPYLVNALRNFISSDQIEITNIELSDGNYSTYLSRSMYDNYSSSDATISADFVYLLKSGRIAPADCYVILENYAAGNKIFKDALSQFSPILDEDNSLRKEIRDLLMRDILDGNPVTFYNIEAMKQAERQRLIDEEKQRQDAREKEDKDTKLKDPEIPEAFVEEETDSGTLLKEYDGYRKFIIKETVSKTGPFWSRKEFMTIEVEIEGDKALPCNCALTVDTRNHKSYREETKVEDLEKGSKGPFQFGPYQLPLPGIEKSAKTLYVHIYPTDKRFPINLFKNNHKEIKL